MGSNPSLPSADHDKEHPMYIAMNEALQSSVWVTSPEFAGYLTKRGFHWRKLWKKRWVALHGAEIVYMDKEPTVDNSGQLTITKSQITAATVIDDSDVEKNPNGFCIHINDGHSPTWHLRAENPREKKQWLMRLGHVHAIVSWLEDFEKVKVLGVGGTGIVYELLHKSNGQRFAMKVMEIKNRVQMDMAIQEAEMLKDIMENVSHRNIMHIEKVFQVGSKFYMVFPLCTGGELYEHIIKRGHFTERDAAVIIRDLVSGLHALHQRNILHLDIKPENILFDSNEPDARIKITDFGLSRMFCDVSVSAEGGTQPTTPIQSPQRHQSVDRVLYVDKHVSMEEMNKAQKAFQESGVLNREALRGTVGYMSPELILLGASSEATDVFAAGVVLYILLCGHPPFHSKSNREVLEKTAKGVYRITGPEWQDIGGDAKDLIKKMLIVDPSKRITTGDILKHPFLAALDNNEESNDIDGIDKGAGAVAISETTTTGKQEGHENSSTPILITQAGSHRKSSHGTVNLANALRLLSGHVQSLRSEKMATSFTRLMSSLQSPDARSSTLIKLVRPVSGTELKSQHDGVSDDLVLMNPDIRQALASAIDKVTGVASGKLSIEQLACILRHFGLSQVTETSPSSPAPATADQDEAEPIHPSPSVGISSPQPASTQSTAAPGLPIMLLCRFIDRDGDGFISTDDIFTTQALIAQRSVFFLKAIFRMYIESVWYPGRQLNLMSFIHAPKRPAASSSSSSSSVFSDSGPAHQDVVEPPKFITGRHVASVFEKLGYDPAAGHQVFNTLVEALNRMHAAVQQQLELDDRSSESQLGSSKGNPWLDGAGSGASRRGSGIGGDNSTSVAANMNPPASPDHNSNSNSKLLPLSPSPLEPLTPEKPDGSSNHNTSSGNNSFTMDGPPSPSISVTITSPASAAAVSSYRMDINDFIKACEMDDVLVLALLSRPRTHIAELLRKAEARIQSLEPTNDGEAFRKRSIEVTSSMLEEELVAVLKSSAATEKVSFPIAKAVGRATLSAAIRLATTATLGAQVLLEATREGMEGDG